MEGIAVAVGNVDAHVTAPAANATEPGRMVAIMGTSTCHVMNDEGLHEVEGMWRRQGRDHAGLWGYEAGQSGVGDIFNWFVTTSVPDSYERAAAERGISIHELFTELAGKQAIGEHGLVALDWHSGNRSVLVDHELSGLVLGITSLPVPSTSTAPCSRPRRSARRIIESFRDSGVAVEELVIAGGLLKNSLLMQIYADVTNLPLSTIVSSQGPALGSAIHAAVAAGAYPDIHAAAHAMEAAMSASTNPSRRCRRLRRALSGVRHLA